MRGHRRNRAAAGAAQQQKSAATLIRDLPELAERLLGVAGKHGRPRSAPSAAELAGLQESLKEALKIVIKDDEAACSVLQNDSVRVAWSVRLPAPDVSGAESAQLKAQRFFGFAAVDLAGSLAHTAFDYRYPGGGFAAELLRTQVLHALARQLASLNQALEGAQTPRPRRFWSSALLCITGAARLCLGLSPYPWQAGLDPALLAQLAEALADSHVVEHLARAILHVRCALSAQGAACQAPDLDSDGLQDLQDACNFFCRAQAGPEAAAAAEHLSRVLLGPCAHHALLVIGLEALAVMEGALGLQEAGAAATCACRGGAAAAAAAESATIEMDTLVALQRCLGMATPHPQAAPPPGGCAAWAAVAPRPALSARLILRLGLAAAGGRPVQGIDAGSIIIIGSGGGGGSGSSSLPADGHRVLLKPQHRAELMWVALEDLGWQLLARRRRPWCGPWPGIAADLWRLAAVASRGEEEDVEARADSLADVISILTLSYLDRLLVAGKWLEYPAEAPLELAAALEGGALPLFERLLRRAGETPAGLEARALSEFCERTGSQACLIWIRVLPLLAYGEPLQAAAFVATVSKLLRRTQARALVADGTQCCAFGPMAACQLMCLRVVCESFEAAPDGGLPPAVRQLMLVLSLALPDWLADLVPLVREAAVLEEAAWREEQRKRDGGCAPGARSPPPASLPLHFALWALLGHLSRPFTSAEPTPAAADAEASAGVTNNGGGGGEFGSGGGGSGSSGAVASWPSRELADDAEVALVGVAMGLLQRRGMDALEAAYMGSAMAVAAIRLSATRPEDVRRALRANDPVFAWRPEAMQTVATAAREATVIIAAAEGLGRVLEAWARGEEGGEEVAVELWEGLQAAGKEAGLYGKAAGQLVPPAEARRRLGLPACSNPACVSLAGDSEAGRLLQLCGRCRREAYCCRECQTAHWRAGHKEACGGGGGKPA